MTAAVRLEWCGAMRDYRDLAHEYGTPCTIRIRGESDVVRDGYSTIKRRSLSDAGDIATYVLPIDRGPDVRKLQSLGIREDCDCAITTPLIDWYPGIHLDDFGKQFAALDLNRMTVEIDGQQFKVADKGLPVRYGERPVAISLALRRN
jgi:hypothetical protein